MSSHADRLAALRSAYGTAGIDGFILSTGDEHLTEFPAPYSRRLHWLSGFSGSTGSVAVLNDAAAIFVDARYTGTVRHQVDAEHWSFEDVPATSVGRWLAENAAGRRIGFDPKLYSCRALATIEEQSGGKVELVALDANPIDALWTDQPARPDSALFVQPIELSGKASPDKRAELAARLTEIGADACVLTALDAIAWLFNIRARDIDIAPLAYGFAIACADRTADLFIDPHRVDAAVRQHLGDSVRLQPYDAFYPALAQFGGKTVAIDPDLTNVAISAALRAGGAMIREERDPTLLPKAIKNPVEIEGMRQAHIRDGAALTRFLHWFALEAPKGQLTELSAAARLNAFREEVEGFHSLSFAPVSAVDANSAIPHYGPTPETDTPIGTDSLYLIDSGGQYPDGTTDVTRTVAVGEATAEMRDRFTRVLKGNIALQTAVFPLGTTGSRLEAIARLSLWDGGVDCSHGIGHGVGHFLNVHEGPAYLAPVARPGEVALAAGMILSNEPGYYKAGHFGIRIENLMVVVERDVAGGDRPMLGFEAITLAPIDRRLIEADLLTEGEIAWLDAYHARVFAAIGPRLNDTEREWLQAQTAPLKSQTKACLNENNRGEIYA